MKTIFIITILNIIELGYGQPSINDADCNKYLEKFGNSTTTVSQLAFTGDISFISGTANAKVNLRYTDEKLFNDPQYFGLVKEDGKTATCLDLKLFKYTTKNYSDPVQVTDLPINSSNNTQYKWRYYSFIIPGNELRDRLVETNNSNQYIYNGYYAIHYYAAGTDQLQYNFYFSFTLTIDRATGAAIDSSFKPLSYYSTVNCITKSDCIAKADTELKWCTNKTCLEYGTPDLHLNDQFVLQQIVRTEGMKGYYLTGTEVWYTGGALNKKATPVDINNTKPGQTIIQLKAEIAWRNVTIKVLSTLSNASGRRVLVQTQFDPVTGETQELECIKDKGSETCPTCEQECQANGFARDGCDACSFSKQIAFIFLALLLAFII